MRKNFFKVPKHIVNKLETLTGDTITIFTFIKISKQDVIDGKYKFLNIFMNNNVLSFPEHLIPDVSTGRYSKYNIEGRLIKLKHLPKVEVSHSFESPNFGDASKGYHTTTITRKVYQTKLIPPKFLFLTFVQQASDDENYYIFKVSTNTLLSKKSNEFYEDLLFHCNLLQENAKNCDVTDLNIIDELYVSTLHVEWELLPPGKLNIDEVVTKMISPKDINNTPVREFIKDRLLFFNNLGAIGYIKGSNVFNSYKGAKFQNNIVLLESFDYGNAVYIFKKNWEELTRLSRSELLSSHNENIIRIKHTTNWKNNIETALKSLLN